MNLLKIAEPGERPAVSEKNPTCLRRAAGIDLGTTHSLIALVEDAPKQGKQALRPRTLKDARGDDIIPSVVCYKANGEQLVGRDAVESGGDPSNQIASIKRLMGRSCEDIKDDKFKSIYQIEAGEADLPLLNTVQGKKNAVEVSADILRYLRCLAEKEINDEPVGVVITVPAYFDDAQRQAVKDAAKLANLNVYRLLNEPTAAAVAYGLDKEVTGTIAIYDLGGGTFDMSVLRLEKGVFHVLATGGDSMLGGDDFDKALATMLLGLLEQLRQTSATEGKDTDTNIEALSAQQKTRLLQAARTIKECLSSAESWEGGEEIMSGEANKRTGKKIKVTRADLEQVVAPFIQRTLKLCGNVLKDAEVSPGEISSVVLVGGSTRMPIVREQLTKFFGKAPLTDIDPDRVVAFGAALQADLLAGNQKDSLLLLDVIPLSLGLETMGGLNERLIPRNASIPVSRHHDFTTYKDGQTAMSFHIVQGEQELVKDCRSLARFVLRGIPPQPAGLVKVRVTFRVDADGLLSVSAQELSSGAQTGVEVQPTYGLSAKEVKKMLLRAQTHAKQDVAERQRQEAILEGSKLLDIVTKSLEEKNVPLSDTERENIIQKGDALKAAMSMPAKTPATPTKDDANKIRACIKEFSEAAEDFMQRRMRQVLKDTVNQGN